MLVPLLALAVGVVWILGGNRPWIMMPVILVTLLVAILFVVRFFVSRYRHDLVIPAGGLVALMLVGYLAAVAPWTGIPYEAWQAFFRFLSYAVAYWVWVNLLRFNHRWRWALAVLMLSVSIMAWYALIVDAQGSRSVLWATRPDQYEMRASGTYICPNHFAHLLQMVMLVSLGVVFSRGVGVPLKLFAGYSVLIGIYPLFLTLSRAGWIGLMAGLVVFALALASRAGLKKFLVAAVVAPLIVGALGIGTWMVSPQAKTRVDQALQGDVRLPLWRDSIEIIREAPWLGHGLGSYRYLYPRYHHHLPLIVDPEFAHNDYIHFWAEIGLAGIALAGLMFLLISARAIRVLGRDRHGGDAALMAGLLAMLAGTAAHTFFDFNLNIFGNVHVMIFLVAALVAATYNKNTDHTVSLARPSAPWTGSGLILLLIMFVVIYGRMTASYFSETRGEVFAHAEQWDDAEKAYQRAIALAPGNWRAHLDYGSVYRLQAFWMRDSAQRQRLIEGGLHHYGIAVRQNPWSPAAWHGMGVMERLRGYPEQALVYFRKAHALVPKQVFYWHEIGHQLRNMRRYEESLEVFSASMKIDPTDIARSNIAILNRWITARAARDQSGDASPPGP